MSEAERRRSTIQNAPRLGTRYQWASGCSWTNCGNNGKVYTVSSITDGSPVAVVTFDRLNRIVARKTNGLVKPIHERMTYTARGQVQSTSEPSISASPPTRMSTTFSYDPLVRQVAKTAPRSDTFSGTRNEL